MITTIQTSKSVTAFPCTDRGFRCGIYDIRVWTAVAQITHVLHNFRHEYLQRFLHVLRSFEHLVVIGYVRAFIIRVPDVGDQTEPEYSHLAVLGHDNFMSRRHTDHVCSKLLLNLKKVSVGKPIKKIVEGKKG